MVPEIEEVVRLPPVRTGKLARLMFQIPWWAIVLGALIGVVVRLVDTDPIYATIFQQLKKGLEITLRVSFLAYSGALIVGLVVGIIRSTTPRPQPGLRRGLLSSIHLIVYQIATLFVELLRGLPILIVLMIAAFVATPNFKRYMLENFDIVLNFKGSSVEVAIVALSLNYGAYLSEIFRAGIQSIEKGQIEAARSLGMTSIQTMRFIVLPQATRRVIPPLGNNFIAMIKDSSLVSVLGLRDVALMGKLWSGSTFRFEQTYLVVAVIYLTMTVIGSIMVRFVEKYLESEER